MTEEELRSIGWPEDDARRYMAAYAAAGAKTGDRITMRTADLVETREADPYAGLDGPDLQAALNARHGGGDAYITSQEMAQFLGERRAATQAETLMQTMAVVRPGSGPDLFDQEQAARRQWAERVGRWFTPQELRGQPRAGCDGCARMGGSPCDTHVRRLGEEIPLPDHPWPSETAGHVPGAVIMRPGQYPGDLTRTVG